MTGVFLILFTLFWSGMVCFFDGMMARGFYKQWQSQHFISTTGTVTYSQIQTHRGSKGGVTYSADIHYSYTVQGSLYNGQTLRFSHMQSSSYQSASALVNAHWVGTSVPVYYNANDPNESLLFPGITGGDFMPALFLTPFNLIALGLWAGVCGWAGERLFKPAAGGVKIIEDGMTTRIRLPQVPAILYGMITTAVLSFFSIFIVGFSTDMQPSIPLILSVLLMVYLSGAGIYFWQQQKINSGMDDLIIHQNARTIELPLTQGRKDRVTIQISNIHRLYVDVIEHHNSKGGVSYTYAPTVTTTSGYDSDKQKLVNWGDRLRANDFTEWLGKKIGVTGTPAPDRLW